MKDKKRYFYFKGLKINIFLFKETKYIFNHLLNVKHLLLISLFVGLIRNLVSLTKVKSI